MSDFSNTVRCNECGETMAADDIDCRCSEAAEKLQRWLEREIEKHQLKVDELQKEYRKLTGTRYRFFR